SLGCAACCCRWCVLGCVGGAICLGECPGGGCSWVEHWLLQNFPATCWGRLIVVIGRARWWWGHTVGLPGNEPPFWGGWLLGAARLLGVLLCGGVRGWDRR